MNSHQVFIETTKESLQYSCDSVLGKGATATVYKGTYEGQPAAIKILMGNDFLLKFEYELANIKIFDTAKLEEKPGHENIIKHYAYFVDQTSPEPKAILIAEFINAGTVHAKLAELELSLSYSLAIEIARALDFLRSIDFVHHDVKSQNLLLTEENGQYHVKLTDFGLSRKIGDEEKDFGAPAYSPPEFFSPSRKFCSDKYDMFGYAIVLWEMLNRKEAQTTYHDLGISKISQLSKFILGSKRLPLQASEKKAEMKFAHLINWCWMQNPTKRASAKNVLLELETDQEVISDNLASKGCLEDNLENVSLHDAVQWESIEYVRKLLHKSPDKIHRTDNEGYTPLHYAMKRNYNPMIDCLLENPKAYNLGNDNDPIMRFLGNVMLPLHKAVEEECVTMVNVLLAGMKKKKEISDAWSGGFYKQILNDKDLCGFTALHHAAANGNTEIARALIEAGADTDILTTTKRKTPWLLAKEKGHVHLLELFKKPNEGVEEERELRENRLRGYGK